MEITYSKKIRITTEHLDKNNHVNNVQYVHWVEEIAAEHWDVIKIGTTLEDDVWVLIDHHIRYKKEVFLNDEVTIKTYPLPPKGIRQPRRVEFYCNDILVADSETLWILIDGKSKKPKKLNENWLDQLSKIS